MKKLIYVLIVIALLAVIGWFGYDKYYSSPEEEAPVVEENINALPEVDLLTYTSPNGFSFDYPTGYTISEVVDPTVAGGYVVHIVKNGVPFPSAQITIGPTDTTFALWEGMEWEYLDEVEASFVREEVVKYSELSPAEAYDEITDVAETTLLAIADKKGLNNLVHPVKGVSLSPYAYIDSSNVILTQLDFTESKKYTWGNYDGRGDIISLSLDEYWDKFVYDKDFYSVAQVGYNEFYGHGNTTNNILTSYPDAISVEYYYPGSADYDQMDWASLILSFEKYNNDWYLVGITHNQWTI